MRDLLWEDQRREEGKEGEGGRREGGREGGNIPLLLPLEVRLMVGVVLPLLEGLKPELYSVLIKGKVRKTAGDGDARGEEQRGREW